MTEITDQTYRGLFLYGIDPSLALEVCLLMATKPLRVQRVFLLRMQGMTQQQIGAELGIPQRTVSRLISRDCADVRKNIQKECLLVAKT